MCVHETTRLSIPNPGTDSIHFCPEGALVGTQRGLPGETLQRLERTCRGVRVFTTVYRALTMCHVLNPSHASPSSQSLYSVGIISP